MYLDIIISNFLIQTFYKLYIWYLPSTRLASRCLKRWICILNPKDRTLRDIVPLILYGVGVLLERKTGSCVAGESDLRKLNYYGCISGSWLVCIILAPARIAACQVANKKGIAFLLMLNFWIWLRDCWLEREPMSDSSGSDVGKRWLHESGRS